MNRESNVSSPIILLTHSSLNRSLFQLSFPFHASKHTLVKL